MCNYTALLYMVGERLVEEGSPQSAEPYFYRALELIVLHQGRRDAVDLLDWWAQAIPNGRLLPQARGLLD